MNDFDPLLSIFIGFLCIFVVITIIKKIRNYYVFKASFYPEIYSGFFEYQFRGKSLKRMSQSYWLENELGYHRIMFQITKTSYKDNVQPYILILLSTGLYVIQIYNESGSYTCKNQKMKKVIENEKNERVVYNLPYPLNEFENFKSHFQSLIADESFPMKYIAAFTDKSELNISLDNVFVVKKKNLIEIIKKEHLNSEIVLEERNIDKIYNTFINKTSI